MKKKDWEEGIPGWEKVWGSAKGEKKHLTYFLPEEEEERRGKEALNVPEILKAKGGFLRGVCRGEEKGETAIIFSQEGKGGSWCRKKDRRPLKGRKRRRK